MEAIRRVFVEKKSGFDGEARNLRAEISGFLGQYPGLAELRGLRLLNRYDVGRLDEGQFRRMVELVLSEPQSDRVFWGADAPAAPGDRCFAVEYLPGQYDQRADSAEQCAELVTGQRPLVRSARVYILEPGAAGLDGEALEAVKRYLINPVDSREAASGIPAALEEDAAALKDIPVLAGFRALGEAALAALGEEYGLAMSLADLLCCRDYFAAEGRDPTLTELRVLDTYWSDHCRHTTFTTALEEIRVEGPAGSDAGALREALERYEAARREVYGSAAPERSLMDMATLGARVLKKRGLLPDLDESAEINACTLRITAEFEDGSTEPWLLLFKNETHNHPTEIEPFGGAATCLGGAIRDPLSGRAFVYQAMRISGGGDPRSALAETLPGKLPQVKIAREAAAGYSSYGNQIGLATGQVTEFYHPGFIAKRMELGAVIGAVPAAWVRREEPAAGDLVILVGGATGRDGIGGATGSSRAHTGESVEKSGAEVQKGNAVEERKLQRLFRKAEVTRLIKRCNDFGAGGVSVAVGELAPGLDITLDAAPKKYAGLDGTELAISESQERMAVVTAPGDAEAFIREAAGENLSAVVIARVTGGAAEPPRLRMFWRGRIIADLSRDFLASSGAPRSAAARIVSGKAPEPGAEGPVPPETLMAALEAELAGLRSGSRRGLQERFDGSIGAASVLFPWGGATQGTPECGMAALLPCREKRPLTASVMTSGYDPDLAQANPYRAAKGAIREALAKYACLGGDPFKARLSLQEYFGKTGEAEAWGRPAGALLGALEAQLELGVPAIGGKDSMSGNYRDGGIALEVPPSLIAFAAGTAPAPAIRSGALSGEAGNLLILLLQEPPLQEPLLQETQGGAAEWDRFRRNLGSLAELTGRGLVRSAYPVGPGGAAAAIALAAFGNMTGVELYAEALTPARRDYQGSMLVELDGKALAASDMSVPVSPGAVRAGRTLKEAVFRIVDSGGGAAERPLALLRDAWESPLAGVYPQVSGESTGTGKGGVAGGLPPAGGGSPGPAQPGRGSGGVLPPSRAVPLVTIPVFPGTNCEWDLERAFSEAGARTRLVVFRNRTRADIEASLDELAGAVAGSQIVALAGGFSAGDEPDGSGKFIANVLRSPPLARALEDLLEKRDGLMLGICNGFQALIKLGLVPYGRIREAGSGAPTLAGNRLGRHVSRMVRTRVMSTLSPWFALEEAGAIHCLPVSHGEGRLVIQAEEAEALFRAGQVSCCYADAGGQPAGTEPDNPNGSAFAIEAVSSPDGRILGKMGHSERQGPWVHVNIPGNKRQRIFEAGVRYF
ncbi:MAG: phosphoribosylformylglycinamidine synthase, partial [Spirochaetaceae bacterium]|nr:phosphoribosylformylglycinamidine synthase [Spirochaetaceae bacterium]